MVEKFLNFLERVGNEADLLLKELEENEIKGNTEIINFLEYLKVNKG